MDYLDKPWLKHYPPDVPHEVEVPEIPVTHLIDNSVRKYPKNTALIYYGSKISYEELGNYIEKTTSALHDLGIKRNSVVALYLPNCPQFVMSYYAIQKLGAIPTAVSFLFSPREIRQQLEDSGAECIIMIDLLHNKIKSVINDLGIDKVILADILYFMPYLKKKLSTILRKVPKAKIPKNEPVYFFEDLVRRDDANYPTVNIDPREDIASIMYTSGTTGMPKGISLTHYNIVASIVQVKASSRDVFEESKYLLAYLPFFHIYGQNVIMTGGLSMGQTLIVILRPKFEELLRYIEKYRISLLFGVPAFFRILIKHIRSGKYDLSSLKVCACGSDYTPQNLKDEWKELTGVDITEGYGLTEAIPATGIPVGGKGKTGSVGIPLPGTIVAVADPEKDKFVKVGAIGELVICGPQVMKGYWNNGNKHPKAFAKIAGKKWVRTEDMGYMDNDGYFYLVERKKDVIKYKGYSIFPGEVENVISEYEPVREAAVVGISVHEYGQIVKAFVVPKDEYKSSITKDDIVEWCKDKLAPYKIPKQIEFVEDLPKSPMEKVIRRKLRGEEEPNH
jgi:long-chain acyl-CoA synthetase